MDLTGCEAPILHASLFHEWQEVRLRTSVDSCLGTLGLCLVVRHLQTLQRQMNSKPLSDCQ